MAHPACLGGQESHLLVAMDQVLRESRRKLEMDRPHGILTHVGEKTLLEMYRTLWTEVFRGVLAEATPGSILVEKTPDHALHLELAHALLPASRVVHLVRHPAAVVASLIHASRTPWGRSWAPGSVDAATRRWIECVEAADDARSIYGTEGHLTVRVESLRDRTAETLEETVRWLGVDAGGDTIETIVRADAAGDGAAIPLGGDATSPVLQEPEGFRSEAGPTPLRGRNLRRCLRIAGPTMERFGYAADGPAE